MDDFSITRPEPAIPARDSGGQSSPRGDARQQRRRPHENPTETHEPVAPDKPDSPGEDDVSHQVDELA